MRNIYDTYQECLTDDNSGWCPDFAICMDWIDRRANHLVENFKEVDSVYMSEDIYLQFIKTMAGNTRHFWDPSTSSEFTVTNIITSAGQLQVKRVPGLQNFCYVGTHSTYDQLVRIKVDQIFEDTVMKSIS